jgi:uncharacterized membrane protein YcaP (DUF421 family)
MDPAQIAFRVLFTWVFVLILIRVSGKRTARHGDLSSFAVAVILGDMVDDVFWAEVPIAQFVTGAVVLVALQAMVRLEAFSRGERAWRRLRSSAQRQ